MVAPSTVPRGLGGEVSGRGSGPLFDPVEVRCAGGVAPQHTAEEGDSNIFLLEIWGRRCGWHRHPGPEGVP